MNKKDVLDRFEKYLELKGYSSTTRSGNKSTTYDYAHVRITFVLCEEKTNIDELIRNIDYYISLYDYNGNKSHLGIKGHRSVINALKRLKEFDEQ